jgi:signal transduction histidine kinase
VSLRSRLLLASLTTLAVGLGALLLVANVLLYERVKSEAGDVLQADATAQVAALEVTGHGIRVRETVTDDVVDRRSWVVAGDDVVERPQHVSPALDRAAVALARQGRHAEIDGPHDYRLLAQPVRAPGSSAVAGVVVVAYATESLERVQKIVLVGSVVVAALIMLAGALAISRALDGALRPVAQMTASAQEWGAHDLDRRFGLGPARDELTALAATLDGLLARIAASRRHEQRFAGEVAHELRTPLAGLQLQAELALGAEGDTADAERRDALAAVIAQSARLSETIDDLLAIARQELDPSEGAVDLLAIARELEPLEVLGPEALPLAEGDPAVVRRALTPLVENAQRHARERVWLELRTLPGRVAIAVRDDGPGLDPALIPSVFDPGIRGPDQPDGGAGLGLALARRLARSCGGDVVVGDGPGGCFVLELPALGPA